MTGKLILSCVIIFCSTVLGEMMANSYKERTQLLLRLIHTLQLLETEIIYSLTPLPLLLQRAAQKSHRDIARIFEGTLEQLEQNQGLLFDQAWTQALLQVRPQLELTQEDFDLLIELGNHLGGSDQENQVKHLRLIREGLNRKHEESLLLQQKNVGLYKYLGILGGLTIVIILI